MESPGNFYRKNVALPLIFDGVLTKVFKAVECGPLLQQAVFSAVVGESGLAVR
jgi:hypothetical protein